MSWFNFSGKKKTQEPEAAEKKKQELAAAEKEALHEKDAAWKRSLAALEIERTEKQKANELEAERDAWVEADKPLRVMEAAFVDGNEVVVTLNPVGDFSSILFNLEPECLDDECAPQCFWQTSILIGEGKSARSVKLDLPPFISNSQYEQSRSLPVFVANDQPRHGFTGRIIYYRDILFLVSRPCINEFDRGEALSRAKKTFADILLPTNRLINQHIATLARKWDQTIYQDDYGNYLFDRWLREFDYFFDNVLRKDEEIAASLSSPQREIWAKKIAYETVSNAIGDYKITQLKSNSHLSVNVDDLDPVEFEHYCADRLRNSGWDVRVTQASGDQGIDLIANRGNVKAVFQCKKYSQPVGNGAVQEIIAGKQFEQAHIAAVVSNSTYTQSAKQLATTTGVHLLHFTELERFAEMAGVA